MSIVAISRLEDGKFRVSFTAKDQTEECTVTASVLLSYEKFKTAVLARTGKLFRYDSAEFGAGKKVDWQNHLNEFLPR